MATLTLDASLHPRLVALVDAGLPDPDFRVESLAEALHLSPRHLRWLVAAGTGQSPRDLFRQRRIARARTLLGDDTRCVANVSPFGRAFRAVTGTTPRADRPARPDIDAPSTRMAGSAQPASSTFTR